MVFMWLKYALAMILVFFSLIVSVLIMPYDDAQVRDFMTADENCGGSCLLGIQPGLSKVSDAMLQLQNHPWTRSVSQSAPGNGYASISWAWSGQQPEMIDAQRLGRITFYWEEENSSRLSVENSIVETITVYTHFRIFLLQDWLGETHSGQINIRPDQNLGYSISHAISRGMMNLSTEMACPVDMLTYWNASARVTISIGRIETAYLPPTDITKVC